MKLDSDFALKLIILFKEFKAKKRKLKEHSCENQISIQLTFFKKYWLFGEGIEEAVMD